MNDRQIDMSQRLYPGSFTFDASVFTPAMQSKIIDASLNGGDTLHSMLAERVEQVQQPQVPTQEMEYLRNLGEFVKTPQFTSALAHVMQQQQQPSPVPSQQTVPEPYTPPQSEPVTNADPFADLFSNDTPVNNQQYVAPGQDAHQPQNQTNVTPEYEHFVRACVNNQVDPNEVSRFLSERTPEDMILLFKEYKRAEAEAGSMRPNQPSQQPTQMHHSSQDPPRSIQNIPVHNQPAPAQPSYIHQRNPLWD